jgi:hypothetical protein
MSAARRDLAADVIHSITSVSTVPASISEKKSGEPSSDRPTSVPSFDMGALALGSMPPPDGTPSIPLDLVVPVRIAPAVGDGASPLAVAVFAHTDGASTLASIAERAGLSLPDTINAFIELLGSGVIDVDTEEQKAFPMASGVFPAMTDDINEE